MRRIFVEPEAFDDCTIYIKDKESISYISVVLRLKTGDALFVSDGVSKAYETRISGIGKNEITLHVITEQPFTDGYNTRITLYQGLPKGSKMDEIVRKSTELGVYHIVPVETARSVPDREKGAQASKLERWQRIAKEAARQSCRTSVPEVKSAMKFSDATAELKPEGYDIILALYELEEKRTLKHALQDGLHLMGHSGICFPKIAVFIGPEGGFEQYEVDSLIHEGASSVTIGETILRTETAGPAAVAMILYECEL